MPETVAGLAGSFLSGRLPISSSTLVGLAVLLAPIAVVWLYVQDNDAGKLTDWNGIGWWGVKAGIAILAITVLTITGSLVLKWREKLT